MAQANARGENTRLTQTRTEPASLLIRELVAHLREHRVELREEWVRRVTEARLLTALSESESMTNSAIIYDQYVDALEAGSRDAVHEFARTLATGVIAQEVETDKALGIILLMGDVSRRSLRTKYQSNVSLMNRILDAFDEATNRVSIAVAVGFVEQRERTIREQQEVLQELSTPVLQVRDRLLILPISGVIDPLRARRITEHILRAIRSTRAKVIVIDITGVAAMDTGVANHLVQTVEASRLLGASVIVTGLSPEIAQTLVRIGVDLTKMNTVGDLQGGIEQAERYLGYSVVMTTELQMEANAR